MQKVFSSNKMCIRTGFHRTKNLIDFLVPSAISDVNRADSVIERSVMLVTIFYFQRNVLKAWFQERAIKSDNHYLAAQITSFIVPYVQFVINSVLGHQLNSGQVIEPQESY